jgi:hypothetical protein
MKLDLCPLGEWARDEGLFADVRLGGDDWTVMKFVALADRVFDMASGIRWVWDKAVATVAIYGDGPDGRGMEWQDVARLVHDRAPDVSDWQVVKPAGPPVELADALADPAGFVAGMGESVRTTTRRS